MKLYKENNGFKPFIFDWGREHYYKQYSMLWSPLEINMSEDVKDWATNLTNDEKELLTMIFRWFTQADVEVAGMYSKYKEVFPCFAINSMFSMFETAECNHAFAYALLIDTLGLPEKEYEEFKYIKQIKNKFDILSKCKLDCIYDVLLTIVVFGAFTEGLQLFGTFAMLLRFQTTNRMSGMCQIVDWSIKDEEVHVESMAKLFAQLKEDFKDQFDEKLLFDDVAKVLTNIIKAEDEFIDLCCQDKTINGLTSSDYKMYVRYLAQYRLKQFGINKIVPLAPRQHPFPWLITITDGQNFENFFETRVTGYAKASTKGNWNEVVYE